MLLFFPFVELYYIGSDTQPYGMLVSMVIVILYWIRKASSSRVYIVAALAGIAMGAFAVIFNYAGWRLYGVSKLFYLSDVDHGSACNVYYDGNAWWTE